MTHFIETLCPAAHSGTRAERFLPAVSGTVPGAALRYRKIALAALLLMCSLGAGRLYATNFVVNNSSDANTGSGVTGTLRYCITQANLSAGPHTITFTVPSVTFASDYPQINRQMTIDGGASKVIIQDITPGDAAIRPFFLIGGATGSTLKNLDIRGGGYEPIRIDGSPTDITLQNINCSNSAGDYWNYGIFITGNATNYTIDNCVLSDIQNGWEAIYIGGTATNVTINKVRMVQAGAGGSTGIRVVGVANTVAITDCLIDLDDEVGNDNGDRGVRFDNNVTGLTMTNDTINRAEIWGIEILGTLTNATMTNVRYVTGNYGDARGLQVYGVVNGLTMNDCYFDMDVYTTLTPAGDDGNYGIYFNTNVANLNIDNLTMHDAEVHSLFVGGALTGTNSITNSTFDEFDGYGGHEMIRFNSTVNNLTMTNVDINCDQTGTTDDSNNGIAFIGTVSNTTLTNVSVNEADDNGIYVWTHATNLSITGGKLTNNYDGIEIYNCGYNRINVDLINIKIDSSTRYGVLFPACSSGSNDDVDFVGDTITNSGTAGIWVFNANAATDVSITGCVISKNGRTVSNGAGIEVQHQDNVIISQNSIYDNAGLGIDLTGNGNC
ncbi:MAG: right-handed parallel beta-helix repeat-containing protein, partial [Saprospiraceae bacterium]|nr:right-handed parallel beta-helix repeat-containing protein [Saprospiraceae bacterium]